MREGADVEVWILSAVLQGRGGKQAFPPALQGSEKETLHFSCDSGFDRAFTFFISSLIFKKNS